MMSDQAETNPEVRYRRVLSGEGVQIRVTLYRELRREFQRYVQDMEDDARSKFLQGEEIPPGETQGSSRAFNALVACFLRLNDDERARHWAKGMELVRICEEQKRGYKGKLPFERNAEGVPSPTGETTAMPGPIVDHPGRDPRTPGKKPRKQG